MLLTYIIYNSILLFVGIFSFLVENAKSSSQAWFSKSMVFFILFIPAAIRYGIGTDYVNYAFVYKFPLFAERLEIGYFYLQKVLQNLNADVQWIFVITSFLIYLPICFFVPKKYYFLTLVFFVLTFYLPSYSMIRQAIAVSFIVVGVIQIVENKNLYGIFVMALAATFHLSALFVMPLVFLRFISFKTIYLLPLVILSSYLIVNLDFINILFNSSLFLNSRYNVYATNKFSEIATINSGIGVMLRLILPFTVLFFQNRITKENRNYRLYIVLTICYILAIVLALNIRIFGRLADLFSFISFLVVGPLIYSFPSKKNRQVLMIILIIVNIAVFQKNITANQRTFEGGGLGISPYETIFKK